IARRHELTGLVRLMIEALVPEPHVAEDGRSPEPVGKLDPLLGLGHRRLALLGRLLGLLLGCLADRPLLLRLVPQPPELVLGLPELLLENAEPPFSGRLRSPGCGEGE